jgi:hypothetical protein
MNRDKIKERFLQDVEKHKLTIVKDNGTHRHLKFNSPGSFIYGFHLTTWPGYLCISGDMGCYVFSRTEDMFGFFRDDKKELSINPGYWHEKLVSDAKYEGSERYDEDTFRAAVKEYYDEWCDCAHESDDWKSELWEEIDSQVLSRLDDYNLERALYAAHEFYYDDFYFEYEFWEQDFKQYTPHFLWCLYAIVWGIQQYDEYHKNVEDMLKDFI